MGIGTNFRETCSRLDQINLGTMTPSTSSTSWWNLDSLGNFFIGLQVGSIAAGGTVDFKLEQAQDSGGTGVKNLKVAQQLTDTDDNQLVDLIALSTDLDAAGGYTHVRATVTVAVANADLGVVFSKYWTSRPLTADLNGTLVAESA